MAEKDLKDKRYVFRLTSRQREFLRAVCMELGEPLPELLVMGVVMVRREVATRSDYLRLKSQLLESEVCDAVDGYGSPV